MSISWNLPDGVTPKMIDDLYGPEVPEEYTEQAYMKISDVIEWPESATAADLINALEEVNTLEAYRAIEIIEGCSKPNPGSAISTKLRNAIIPQAEDWVTDEAIRIYEIANEDIRF